MIKDNKIYLQYKKYESLYGQTRRPAIVRYCKKDPTNSGQGSYSTDVICTLYIDGKTDADEIENLRVEKNFGSLVIVSPFHSDDYGFEMYDLEARAFNEFSVDDWVCLFHDTSEFHRMGDKLSFANLAIALERFQINVPTIVEALSFFREDVRTRLLDFINYIAYGLSVQKIKQIAELNNALGNSTQLFFPIILEDAAKQFGIEYEHFSVHSLVDKLFEECENQDIDNPCGFVRVIQWLQDEEKNITLEELEAGFAYLGEDKRVAAIKRYFYDVKRGAFQYNNTSLKAFSSQNYQYYSTLRYIFEKWPGNRNVSTEFLLDCLKTYEQTNQERFQISDGILDWAIQKSIEVNRPIEMNFRYWLCYCQGGILINKNFRGFASFEIQYELDDYAFEEEQLRKSIHAMVGKYCKRLFHWEEVVVKTDPKTGEPFRDPKTNKIETTQVMIYENRWSVLSEVDGEKVDYEKYADLFVNWDKKPETEPENDVFTPEMVDYSIVRDRVEAYLNKEYGSLTPYVSERCPDDIVKMFAYEIGMRATMDNSISMGENPGVDESVVKQRITGRMAELFGETFECEYDPVKYHRAIVDSLFRLIVDYNKRDYNRCFEKREKMYGYGRRIYCAPELTDSPNLLTGRKCANCQGDMCFMTGIKKNPDWEEYTLIHILEIIGYHVLEETEAGLIPNPVYIQFVTQINKAILFAKRLVCKECGHILFPAQKKGHSRFKCLMPSCPEFNEEVYLNLCHDCKRIIDSRDTKQCPNGMYICPSCGSCCSNEYFEFMADKYRVLGKKIPLFISRNIGNGHRDRNMFFCHKCGAQMVDVADKPGKNEWRCLACDPLKDEDAAYYEVKEDYPPIGEEDMIQEPWA